MTRPKRIQTNDDAIVEYFYSGDLWQTPRGKGLRMMYNSWTVLDAGYEMRYDEDEDLWEFLVVDDE